MEDIRGRGLITFIIYHLSFIIYDERMREARGRGLITFIIDHLSLIICQEKMGDIRDRGRRTENPGITESEKLGGWEADSR